MAHSQGSQFDDLLSSGGDIEGLFQQKRRLGRTHASYPFLNESVGFSSSTDSDFQDPREILEQQVLDYNRRRSLESHISLSEVSWCEQKPKESTWLVGYWN